MSKRILVVDDSRFIRNQIKKVLSKMSYEIFEASNGQEALTLASENQFDTIITDLVMPGMDGLAFVSELKNKKNLVPVIVLTADIQEPVRKECLALGVRAFLNKPFESEDLERTLNEIE